MQGICGARRFAAPQLMALFVLAGCASHRLSAPVAQTSSLTGNLETGTVVSIRQVTLASPNGALNQVLTALGQAPASFAQSGEEIVIRRGDGSVASIVQPLPAGQPGFVPGEQVAIVEAGATVLRPQ